MFWQFLTGKSGAETMGFKGPSATTTVQSYANRGGSLPDST